MILVSKKEVPSLSTLYALLNEEILPSMPEDEDKEFLKVAVAELKAVAVRAHLDNKANRSNPISLPNEQEKAN